MKTYRLGCSGWSYSDWVGKFYPEGCPQSEMLQEYSKHFDTVEINMSFYRLPFESIVRSWETRTPSGFLFSPKMSRSITHVKKLRGCEDLVSQFVSRMSLLRDKLGPVLIQLHPNIKPDPRTLESFVNILPARLRYAVEFRDEGWLTSRTRQVLEKYGIATCLVDSPRLFIADEVTASFAYVRWHGRKAWYHYDYSSAEIDEWARRLTRLPVDSVFGYWNNDVNAHAPKNCLEMKRALQAMSSS